MPNKLTAHQKLNIGETSSSRASELQGLADYYKKSSIRLEAARSLAERRDQLVKKAAEHVFQAYPSELSTDQKLTYCMRDIGYFIKVVEYCLVSDSSKPVDEVLNGLREIYFALELSLACCIEALNFIRTNHGLVADQALEANIYIDLILATLS